MLSGLNQYFGGRIEEKVSGLEACHVAILYCLRLGRLGNAWIFKFGRLLCSKSLLFEAWKAGVLMVISVALWKRRSEVWKASM